MIYSLSGKLIIKKLNLVIIECNGVGYCCKTSYNTISQLGCIGSKTVLYTCLSFRTDAIELFGFATEQELSCFKMLISVSGIGSKAALSILSDNTPEQFAFNVASSDIKAFTKIKGIGKRIAQRVILELKEKITSEFLNNSIVGIQTSVDVPFDESTTAMREALEALMVLGYSKVEALAVLNKLDPTLSTQTLIKETLKYMIKQ